jgi:hypothetical protein
MVGVPSREAGRAAHASIDVEKAKRNPSEKTSVQFLHEKHDDANF